MTESSAALLVHELRRAGLTVATCESLTGGGVGFEITRIAGASNVYRGGIIAYASDLKASLVGVDSSWIDDHGVINEDTARQMAIGVRRLCGADLGLATTGVAGPEPQDGQPVGTVWLAVAGEGPQATDLMTTRRLLLRGTRDQIRRQTVEAALNLTLDYLASM